MNPDSEEWIRALCTLITHSVHVIYYIFLDCILERMGHNKYSVFLCHALKHTGLASILLSDTHTAGVIIGIMVHLCVVSSAGRLKDKLATRWQQYTAASVVLY